MTEIERWAEKGREYGWHMPTAPLWKRLPVIRHIRTWWGAHQVERWYASGPGMIGLRSGYDNWVLFGMWHGFEKAADCLPEMEG